MTTAAKKTPANKTVEENATQKHVELQAADVDANEDIVRQIRLIELETAQLNLDRQRRINAEETLDQRTKEQRAEDAQRNLEDIRAGERRTQKACRHRQGGFGLEQTLRGKGDPTLVAQEGPIAGHRYILCTRCLGEWRTPNPGLKKTDPQRYARELEEFEEINELLLEASSQTLGSPMFAFEKHGVPFVPDRV